MRSYRGYICLQGFTESSNQFHRVFFRGFFPKKKLRLLLFNLYYISMQCYYISMQLIGWSFCYISSRAMLHFYAAFLLHFYASFITFLCRYYISMQGYYISMQVITFLAFITFLCPTPPPNVISYSDNNSWESKVETGCISKQ